MPSGVLVIPGFSASSLRFRDALARWQTVWLNPLVLAGFGPKLILLNPDGTSPSPSGNRQLLAGPLVPGYYGGLLGKLQQLGYETRVFPYDWRRSLLEARQGVIDALTDLAATSGVGDVYVVAHSMGGLLARLAYPLAPDTLKSRWKRTVYLGTPHGGAPEAGRTLFKDGDFYAQVNWWAKVRDQILVSSSTEADLYQTLLSWPGFFQLLPNYQGPWRELAANAQWFYSADHYPFTPGPAQAMLDQAAVLGATLNGLLDQPRPAERNVIGTESDTVGDISLVAGAPTGAVTDGRTVGPVWVVVDGDGVVPTERAMLQGVSTYRYEGMPHYAIPQYGPFLDALDQIIENSSGGDFGPFPEPIQPQQPLPAPPVTIPGGFYDPALPDRARPGSLIRLGDP